MPAILLILAIIVIGIGHAKKKKNAIRPIVYERFNKKNFDKTVHFTCEFCGEHIDSSGLTCPHCGGEYNKNPDYIAQKKVVYTKYLEYLKKAEADLIKERENIAATVKLQKNAVFMKRNFYNFDIKTLDKNKPVYKKKKSYEFSCDFCGAKIVGSSKAKDRTCPYCGADYSDDIELLTLEQEEATDKAHYEEYKTLRKLMEDINAENDEIIEKQTEKYRKFGEKSQKAGNAFERIFKVGKVIFIVICWAALIFILYKFVPQIIDYFK